MTCHNCGIDTDEMAYIRSADPADFDGLNMAGGDPDAICCEVAL